MGDDVTNKRARVYSDAESNSDAPERKRNRSDSENKSEEFRVDSAASEFETSSGSRDVRNDILSILDGSETVPDEIQDLDSVIRSFEEEILQSPAPETTSWTGESQPDLGYLLEASDDELGLPPVTSPAESNQRNEHVPSYDSFELPSDDSLGFGFGEEYGVANEFLAVGGLFEYPEASDFSEFLWRPEMESLPAV